MLRSFTGYRGVAALAEIGGVKFVIAARNLAELEAVYTELLPKAPPFNPDACQTSIFISSKLLPEPKPTHEQKSSQDPNA